MSYCINCGHKLDEEYEFCPECGRKIGGQSKDDIIVKNQTITKLCNKCGADNPANMPYCLYCGAQFNGFVSNVEHNHSEKDPLTPVYYVNDNIDDEDDFEIIQERVKHQFGTWRNKWTSLFLCIILGWMGAHKYYEGKVGMGILYTFTLGLFFIGWIIDIIVLIFKPNPYQAKK